MTFSTKDQFNIKTMQSLMKEVGVYAGKVDGWFGDGCVIAAKALMKATKPDYNVVLVGTTIQPKEVYKFVQLILQRVDLYAGKLDGLWGEGSLTAFKQLIENHRVKNGLPKYGYAWTTHPNLTPEVVAKVEAWMTKWNKPLDHVSYLFSCFALETGETFNPAIQNKSSKARGLIQFMPNGSMIDLGVTDDQLKVMSVYEQLDWVFAYFEKYGYIKKCVQLEDYYLSIFYPARVGTDLEAKLGVEGTKLYSQNNGFDQEKKGYYTVGDIAKAITTFYWKGMDISKRVQL